MVKWLAKTFWHYSARGNKKRVFLFYTITIILLLKLSHRLFSHDVTMTSSTSHYDVTIEEYDVIMREVDLLSTQQPDIVKHVTKHSVIDSQRTQVLIKNTRRKIDNHFLILHGQCALAQPVSQGILHRSSTANIDEYIAGMVGFKLKYKMKFYSLNANHSLKYMRHDSCA